MHYENIHKSSKEWSGFSIFFASVQSSAEVHPYSNSKFSHRAVTRRAAKFILEKTMILKVRYQLQNPKFSFFRSFLSVLFSRKIRFAIAGANFCSQPTLPEVRGII
jgi:hypothetical protein